LSVQTEWLRDGSRAAGEVVPREDTHVAGHEGHPGPIQGLDDGSEPPRPDDGPHIDEHHGPGCARAPSEVPRGVWTRRSIGPEHLGSEPARPLGGVIEAGVVDDEQRPTRGVDLGTKPGNGGVEQKTTASDREHHRR
jgi:hypothetical protein